MWKYTILTIDRPKGRETDRMKDRKSELVDADIDPRYVTVSSQFLPSAAPLSILDPCSLPYYSALINLLEKRAFSNGGRCSVAERFVVPADTAISPHI